jgi:hypothetical protein
MRCTLRSTMTRQKTMAIYLLPYRKVANAALPSW